MDKEKLYELLDIDTPTDFQYFENLAALLECEEDIEEQVLYSLVEEVDKQVLSDLIYNYFEEMTDFLPGDAAETFGIMERIKFALIGLARNCDEEDLLVNLADELDRFRRWYSVDSRVYCTSISDGEEISVPVRDAVVLARSESLTGDRYEYDYSECQDYPLEEYIMSLGDLAASQMEEETSSEGDPDERLEEFYS
ncbi:MAG: hypothetical protein PUK54_04755 [Firmicutes bacterium]|nr:hypothetical protein [Bacillota bacterium]MDD7601903.1 hypothetical protein [Bacillota bacterium]MDY5855919.1 hypothetical protein [Anaerovoracaceae bacterium]